MSRRRSNASSEAAFSVYTVHPVAAAPFVSIVVQAPGMRDPQPYALSLGDAYELGRRLVDEVDALLAGATRPWDGDPGRTPFASRPGPRAAARRAQAAGGTRARSRAPRDGYPRARRIRPDRPLDSGE